ncbi:mandelate racemase/muconate lactonizing enzyme family protein [Luteitalea sp.]|uniref:mandelate racemase/muconate lactonizing enzyme family protein n=1 Tax=Luteitalea sp. TaxID=2004800 RepID=UPI0025BFBEA9|nr:mandelate racemase/muconate lactonizing enzyme family protein [Luteitalea sp.]
MRPHVPGSSDITRRGWLAAALAVTAVAPVSAKAQAARDRQERLDATRPLVIRSVEPLIIRNPPTPIGFDEPLDLPSAGDMTGGVGLWNRLDHASPTRFKGFEQAVLVKITTESGLVGWGECHAPSAPRMHQRVITDLFAPLLRGQDARRINALWERLFTTERVRGYSTGVQLEALAGVDLAMWDLLGKAVGLPVYQLLGGRYRAAQPLYRGIGGATLDALVADARAAKASGMQMVKMGYRKGKGSEDIERVSAVSEAMGRQGQVAVDSLGAFKLYEAIQAGRRFDRLGNVGWFEDALLPDDQASYPKLAEALETPVCAGEMLNNRFQIRDLLATRGADIINPDVCRAGGITECQRIAALAEAFNVPWSPHVSTGTILYFSASLHLAVATPNCVIMEGGNKLNGPLGNVLVRTPLRLEQGTAVVPEGPGFGIDWNEEALANVTVAGA